MSAITDLLNKNKNLVPKPQPAIPSKEASVAALTAASNQATGMSSSADTTSFMPSAPPALPDGDYDRELASKAVTVYAVTGRLRRTFLAKGGKFEAINGYFYVTTEAQEEVMQQHLAKKHVRAVDIDSNGKEE